MSCGLLPDFPYAVRYKSPLCPIACPNWKYDAHLQDFCQKFGHFAPHLCQKPVNPCLDVHIPMYHFDKFTKPPLFQTSKCSTKFRYQDKAFVRIPTSSQNNFYNSQRTNDNIDLKICYKSQTEFEMKFSQSIKNDNYV